MIMVNEPYPNPVLSHQRHNHKSTSPLLTASGLVSGRALCLEDCNLIGGSGTFHGVAFIPAVAAADGVPTEFIVRNSTIGSNVGGNVDPSDQLG